MSNAIAQEMRDFVRRAAGDVAGKTVAAQIRQAARHLGYDPENWRVREAWYGRSGRWSPTAVDDLRARFAAWREGEVARAIAPGAVSYMPALAERLGAIRRCLAQLRHEVDGLETAVVGMLPEESSRPPIG